MIKSKAENPAISIIYFSPAGNCRRIAEAIARHFDGKPVLCDITQPSARENFKTGDYDLLFFICPVYGHSYPDAVKEFLQKNKPGGAVVPCVAYGSVSAGRALKGLARNFKKNGADVYGGAEFATFHCYLPDFETSINDEDIVYRKEIESVMVLCEKVISRYYEKMPYKERFKSYFNPFSLFAPKLRARLSVKKPDADKEKCTGCNLCKNICPLGAINEDLRINTKCSRCTACIICCHVKARKLVLRPLTSRYLKKYYNVYRKNVIY